MNSAALGNLGLQSFKCYSYSTIKSVSKLTASTEVANGDSLVCGSTPCCGVMSSQAAKGAPIGLDWAPFSASTRQMLKAANFVAAIFFFRDELLDTVCWRRLVPISRCTRLFILKPDAAYLDLPRSNKTVQTSRLLLPFKRCSQIETVLSQ